MKRSWPTIVGGTVLALGLVIYMITFQVRFSEVAVVRTFGEIKRVVTEPGLYWKWPWPIQKVNTYDHRIQTTSTTGEETPTRDGKNVVVTTTVCWRIDDPEKFSVRCKDMDDAENKIKIRVRNDQKTVIGNYDFNHFVSTDPEELEYDEIETEIARNVQAIATDLYGIRVERVAIEQLALPKRITETVIEAMKKEREAVAQRYTSEGESQAKQIKDTAESIAETIMTFAERKAREIVAEGQERAIKYNRVFREDEALATFLLQIENIPKLLADRATLILDHPVIVDLFRPNGSGAMGEGLAENQDVGEGTALAEDETLVPTVIDTK